MLPSDPARSRREAAAVFLFLSCRQKNLCWASERLSREAINPGLPATLSYVLLQGLRPSPPAHLLGLSTAVAPHPIPASTRRPVHIDPPGQEGWWARLTSSRLPSLLPFLAGQSRGSSTKGWRTAGPPTAGPPSCPPLQPLPPQRPPWHSGC